MNSKRRQRAKPPEDRMMPGFDPPEPAAGPEIPPDDIPVRLREDIRRWKMEADKHREYFREKGINPFQEAHAILLSFFNSFDTVAGLKAE